MDSRKVTLVATIAAIALVAVGIGYAYTAATSNSGNTTGVEYIILTPSKTGSDDSYSGALTEANNKVTWSTSHNIDGVTFTLGNVSEDVKVAGFQNIGHIYVKTDDSKAKDGTTFQLKVSSSGLDNTNYSYKLVFGYGTTAAAASEASALNATDDEEADENAVKAFIGENVTYTAETPMTVENSNFMVIDIYVQPKDTDAFKNVTNPSSLPKAINNGTFTFTLETITPTP